MRLSETEIAEIPPDRSARVSTVGIGAGFGTICAADQGPPLSLREAVALYTELHQSGRFMMVRLWVEDFGFVDPESVVDLHRRFALEA